MTSGGTMRLCSSIDARATRRHVRTAKLVAAGAFAAALAAPALAQQTIFNVPSADVLDKGKTYLEADALWRPQDPSFGFFTMRGVYGFGSNIEAGANFGGFASTGRSVPFVTVNVKWQPWHNDKLAFTTGGFGLFYLRGSEDGNAAALWYGEASYKLTSTTRLTAGGYWATSGYAATDPQAGAVVGLRAEDQRSPESHRRLVQRRERPRVFHSRRLRAPGKLDDLRRLLDQERRLEGQRRPVRARFHFLRRTPMWDLVFLAITVFLFWISVVYTRRCDRI